MELIFRKGSIENIQGVPVPWPLAKYNKFILGMNAFHGWTIRNEKGHSRDSDFNEVVEFLELDQDQEMLFRLQYGGLPVGE